MMKTNTTLTLSLVLLLGCEIPGEADLLSPEAGDGAGEVEEVESPVVGGTNELQHRHPWVVTVQGSLTCRGVLIHPSWVLTAAHCIGNLPATVSYQRTDPETGVTTSDSRGVRLDAPKRGMYVHPQYQGGGGFSTPKNDIALLRLATPFPITRHLQTVALPGAAAVVGRVGAIANFRHKVAAPSGYYAVLRDRILGPTECPASPGFLCVRSPAASLCEGDSGSGFVMTLDQRATVVGIASYAQSSSCDTVGLEGGLTDVFPHLPWILDTMKMTREQVAGPVRLRWSGVASKGSMWIQCDNGVGRVEARMDVPGGELGLDCGAQASASVACVPTGGAELVGFTRRTITPGGAVSVASLPFAKSFTAAYADPSASVQQFTCAVADPFGKFGQVVNTTAPVKVQSF